ncbi:MAG: ABC transporter ATP-binding protein [Pseudomonadota bacterium]|nr:ABC transporter ATP-binding protein [Pseudomonadota bacterium]
MPAISFKDVTKIYYRDFWRRQPVKALDSFSLEVEVGACFAFLGLNGAGKSTAIRVLLGFTRPTGGSAHIHNRLGTTHPLTGVGFLAENIGLPGHLSPEYFLRSVGKLAGMSKSQTAERTAEILAFVGLTGVKGQVKNLSRGMRQRFGLAQALIHDPDFLILDEPFTGLDIAGRREIIDRLRMLHQQGKTIFFSSHILEDVARLATHVGIIHQGQSLGVYPVEGFENGELEAFFLDKISAV